MPKIIQHHPNEAVAFPRVINPGVELVNVSFEDFTIEVKNVQSMGKVEIIHQVALPKIALQVVHAKNLGEFDRLLGKGMSMHLPIVYITGDYTFFVIYSGMQGNFTEGDTDIHVQLHLIFDAERAGASWYQQYRNKISTSSEK